MATRKRFEIDGTTFVVNPNLASKLITRAIALLNEGKNWTKGEWVKYNGQDIADASPGLSTGVYSQAYKQYKSLSKKDAKSVCMCIEGAVGMAAAETINGFDTHSTNGRVLVKAVLEKIADEACEIAVQNFNDDESTDWPKVRSVLTRTRKFFNKLAG